MSKKPATDKTLWFEGIILVKIVTELDPENFTSDEVEDEFGGTSFVEIGRAPRLTDLKTCLFTLLELGLIEKTSAAYRVTGNGMVEADRLQDEFA